MSKKGARYNLTHPLDSMRIRIGFAREAERGLVEYVEALEDLANVIGSIVSALEGAECPQHGCSNISYKNGINEARAWLDKIKQLKQERES